MLISEIGLCSGHSASGVWVSERGETTVPGLYAAGDMACVPHNYLLGALTYGQSARKTPPNTSKSWGRAKSPTTRSTRNAVASSARWRAQGLPHHQYEYKVRRLVNDYLQPPKTETRMQAGLQHFLRAQEELEELERPARTS